MYRQPISRLLWALFIHVIFLVSNSHEIEEVATSPIKNPQHQKNRLIVLTSVDDVNKESFIRFNRSISAFELKLELIRLDSSELSSEWTTTAATTTSDNTVKTETKLKNLKKFELLRKALSGHKTEQNSVILLADSSHSIINGHEHDILAVFDQFNRTNNTQILFSSDFNCWPDLSLAEQYPLPANDISHVSDHAIIPKKQKRFLNSQLVIGYASALWDLLGVTTANLKEETTTTTSERSLIEALDYDLQLYTTRVFLNSHERKRLQLEIDYRSALLENLSGDDDQIELDFSATDERVEVKNLIHNTKPLVIHGSGLAKIVSIWRRCCCRRRFMSKS